MLFKNFSLKENYFFIFILLGYFFLSIYQINYQHWSAMMDHDFYILYNSLLISSGLEQEGRDHPALITFLLHGFIFKMVSIFQNNFSSNIDIIFDSGRIDETFQFYFKVLRMTNYLINLVLFLSFLRLINLLKINKKIIFFTSLIFIFSSWYMLSFFSIRSENLSLLFIILSLIYIIKNDEIKLSDYFISGIFFSLAMFTKIQIIFFILYLILFIGISIDNNKKVNITKIFYKININYLIFSLIFLFCCYLIFQFKIQEFTRFERNKYLDPFVFTASLIATCLYFFATSNFKYKLFKEKIILLSTFLHGFVFCFIVLILFDYLKILNINDFIFLRITNPVHYMSEFEAIYAEGAINVKFILTTLLEIFKNYEQNIFELIPLLIIILFMIKFYNQKKFDISYSFSLLTIFFLIVFINGLRPSINYHLYYTFCYLIVFATSINNFDKRYINFFCYSVLLLFLFNNTLFKSYYEKTGDRYTKIFERKNLMIDICKEFRFNTKSVYYDGTLTYLKYWHKKFDNKMIDSVCKEIQIK